MSKRLTREEEIEAWERGDYNAVVENVLPFARKIIRKVANGDRYLEEEFTSFTNEVLAKAVKSFQPGQYRFITYSMSHLLLNLYKLRDQLYRSNTAMVSNDIIDCIDSTKSHELATDNLDMANHILDAVCDERERKILLARYSGYTMREVGAMFNVSKQRIGEINRAFLNDARTYLQKRFVA